MAVSALGQPLSAEDIVKESLEMRAPIEALYQHRRSEHGPWFFEKIATDTWHENALQEAAAAYCTAHGLELPWNVVWAFVSMEHTEKHDQDFLLDDMWKGLGFSREHVVGVFEAVDKAVDAEAAVAWWETVSALPVRTGLDPKDAVDGSSQLRRMLQYLDKEVADAQIDLRIRWFAVHEAVRDATHSTSLGFARVTSLDPHLTWLREELRAGNMSAEHARTLFQILSTRRVLTPSQIGTIFVADNLAAAIEPSWPLANYDFRGYRRLALDLGEALARSIDTDPSFRLDNLERHGDLWYAMYVKLDNTYGRDFETLGGYNATVAIANWRRTQHRGALVNLALHVHQSEHGGYPETLDALGPGWFDAVPIDAFDGVPIRYRLLDSGDRYLLYSVGWDGVDNNGVIDDRAEAAVWPPNESFERDNTGFDYRLDPWAPG